MAQIRLDLNQFKASGVYTLEFDMSENITLNSQTVRLIVGFSRKGPFNAPVFLPDKKTALQVFGEIDPFLEKNGSYFHRALFTALEVGPVFGLNLMWLDNDTTTGDKAEYQSFSLSSLEQNGVKKSELLSSYYNKERFWFPDQEYFLANVNSDGSLNSGSILNIVNLSQTPVTMLIRKTNSIRQFNVTAVEWYGEGNVPPYVDPSDFISDYFVEVSLIQGDWTNYSKLSNDLIFGKYFNQFGLKKSYYKEFLDLEEVRTLGVFTGSIIPELRDSLGTNFAIDTIINSTLASTGVFVAIDKDALENYSTYNDQNFNDQYKSVDLVGHGLAGTKSVVGNSNSEILTPHTLNYLSYSAAISENFNYEIKGMLLTDGAYNYDEYNPALLSSSDLFYSFDLGTDIVFESQHLGGDYGYLNNIISFKVNSDTEEYAKFKSSIRLNQSLIKLNPSFQPALTAANFYNSANYPFGVISQYYEYTDNSNQKWLKIVYKNTNKSDEKSATAKLTTQGIYKDASSGNFVVFFNTADITPHQLSNKINMQILVEKGDVRSYLTLKGQLGVDENPAKPNAADIGTSGDINKNGYRYNFTSIDEANYEFFIVEGDVESLLLAIDPNGTANSVLTAVTPIAWDLYSGNTKATINSTYIPYIPNTLNNVDTPIFVMSPNFLEASETFDVFYANTGHPIYLDYKAGALLDGTEIKIRIDGVEQVAFLKFNEVKSAAITFLQIQIYETRTITYKPNGEFDRYNLADLLTTLSIATTIDDSDDNDHSATNTATGATGGIKLYPVVNVDLFGVDVNLYENLATEYVSSDLMTFRISRTNSLKLQTTDFVVSKIDNGDSTYRYKLSRILSKKKVNYGGVEVYEYKVNTPIFLNSNSIVKFNEIDEFVSFYKLFTLSGFKLQSKHLPGGTNPQAQLTKILGMLDSVNSNLGEVLKDRDVIQFRYIVDTFDGGLYPMTYPKTYLTKLAKERQKCLALMNTPSMRLFRNSNDPRFTEATTAVTPKPVLNTAYIAEGANNSLGPSFTFSLPDEFNGSKFAGYFSPFLAIRENGRTIYIPPAAHVSNLFVQKFVNGTPFHIVAGPKRGVISEPKLVGLEYDFLLKDRENLEPIGINPIVKKRGVGYMIYGNQMAYQKTKSAFNNLHVRDLLITIEEAIEDLLGRYLFDFNNPTTRIEIKNQVDAYLDKVRALQGIYTFETRMDETNNGSEIIRENMGIIDIAIEPQMGFHKFINRVHVYQYGGIQSTGFDVQNVII